MGLGLGLFLFELATSQAMMIISKLLLGSSKKEME
jgi:hypothetical protein